MASGFSDAGQPFEYGMPPPSLGQTFKAVVGPAGRVVIPAEVRKELGIEEGTTLHLILEGDTLTIRTADAAWKRAQAIAAKYKKPGESVVDEFLAGRRAMWGEE